MCTQQFLEGPQTAAHLSFPGQPPHLALSPAGGAPKYAFLWKIWTGNPCLVTGKFCNRAEGTAVV